MPIDLGRSYGRAYSGVASVMAVVMILAGCAQHPQPSARVVNQIPKSTLAVGYERAIERAFDLEESRRPVASGCKVRLVDLAELPEVESVGASSVRLYFVVTLDEIFLGADDCRPSRMIGRCDAWIAKQAADMCSSSAQVPKI